MPLFGATQVWNQLLYRVSS